MPSFLKKRTFFSTTAKPTLFLSCCLKPSIKRLNKFTVECKTNSASTISGHDTLNVYFQDENHQSPTELLFTENETNFQTVFNIQENEKRFYKDAINKAIVHNEHESTNPESIGTKVAAHFYKVINSFATYTVWIRISPLKFDSIQDAFKHCQSEVQKRIDEADEFYDILHNPELDEDERSIQRQALAGLLWNKQFYNYSVLLWNADMSNPYLNPYKLERKNFRNKNWIDHLHHSDIISMPDKWEYPWYAIWDIAFHVIPLSMVDIQFAKNQMLLFLTEQYMHPNGQLPSYEWNYDDVNPPIHAWATWRLYCTDKNSRENNRGDLDFLQRSFQKLLINFAWWINRKDIDGKNVFEGGFLGMDNIGVFDRSHPLPTGGNLEQADGSAWMAMYCLNMLAMALELAVHRSKSFEDLAIKFFDHFILIANTMSTFYDKSGHGLWDESDGFFYDVIKLPHDGQRIPIKVISFVGLIPLFAVETIEDEWLKVLPKFKARMDWYVERRPNKILNLASFSKPGKMKRRLLSVVDENKFKRIMSYVLDEEHFLCKYGIRTLSKIHEHQPYTFDVNHQKYTVAYEPAESQSPMFGGNSNWRGPVWFPVNYLMIESLQKFNRYYGDMLTFAVPTHSNDLMTLEQITVTLSQRLCSLFTKSFDGKRPIFGDDVIFHTPEWTKNLLFYEYFNAETGKGLGASHQTGWTSLVAKLLQQCSVNTNKYRARSVFFKPPEKKK